MSIHNTTAPRASQAEPEVTEPARRASRFDERGIALQTVIIMVVLLAIAGAVAAVLLSRANETTTQLENTDPVAGFFAGINDYDQCVAAGGFAGKAAADATAATQAVTANQATGSGDFTACWPKAS